MYALSTWGSYISVENESRLNKVFRKAKRYGYTDSVLTFSKLLEQSDEQLFLRVVCSNHCLFHLLEKDKSLFHMSLRPRGHSFDLPRYQYNLTIRKFFIYRNLNLNQHPSLRTAHMCMRTTVIPSEHVPTIELPDRLSHLIDCNFDNLYSPEYKTGSK